MYVRVSYLSRPSQQNFDSLFIFVILENAKNLICHVVSLKIIATDKSREYSMTIGYKSLNIQLPVVLGTTERNCRSDCLSSRELQGCFNLVDFLCDLRLQLELSTTVTITFCLPCHWLQCSLVAKTGLRP